MRQRLFKNYFFSSMVVVLLCLTVLGTALRLTGAQLTVLQLFTPLLVTALAAVGLSALFAWKIAVRMTEPLDKIDLSRPDERDVEVEIKPLVRRLNDQNRQIRRQMEELAREHEKQDKIRREFTANVSHELKTPLTSISGFAELMRDGLVRPEDMQRFAGKIYEEAQRLISLVGDILRLSRLEDPIASAAVEQEPICLREVAEQVWKELEPVAKKLQVAFSVQGDAEKITGSSRIVEEILYNLCDNALKYNRLGGTVDVIIAEQDQSVCVTVRDTGIGIPKEERERIFERFYRVDKSHSRSLGGTGLGLSIVKHGAASIGASISLESELGKGTAVTITFPRNVEVCR